MATSVIEKILGNNSFLTDNYIKDTIALVKSIVFKGSKDANLVNEYITLINPGYTIDYTDKTTWRYYKHLNAEYHSLDSPIEIVSLDNGNTIILNKQNLTNNPKTKKELLKFGKYYKEVASKHKEQELYIKACIADNLYNNINDIIALDDFTIIAYNKELIEPQEYGLIESLQNLINNYKNIWLIKYYSMSDSLFLASQYAIFYQFLLTSIIALRLKSAKTSFAHSYHIKNYLASHHYLDNYYNYLTDKQRLYLYKNLLYLDNHAGNNFVFTELIDVLLTERNISLVTYDKKQKNQINPDNYIDYKFNQRLLNKKNLLYSTNDFNLDAIKNKEYDLAPSNYKVFDGELDKIDFRLKNSLFNTILTKDLESIVVDNTDVVKYLIIDIIIDYWAYMLSTNNINFLVSIINPTNNNEYILNTKDLFKLFVAALYTLNNVDILNLDNVNHPDFYKYRIKRVFKPILPSNEYLLSLCFRKYHWFEDVINEIKAYILSYSLISSAYQYQAFTEYIYKLELGLWILLSNFDDKNVNGQFELMIDRLHMTDIYNFNDEDFGSFLNRIGFSDLINYNNEALEKLIFTILDNMYYNKLSFTNAYKYIQDAIIKVFNNFNSYTIQIVKNYLAPKPILAGLKDTRAYIDKSASIYQRYFHEYILNIDLNYNIRNSQEVNNHVGYNSTYAYIEDLFIDINSNFNIDTFKYSKINVNFKHSVVIDSEQDSWIVNQSSEEDLLFLATNQ